MGGFLDVWIEYHVVLIFTAYYKDFKCFHWTLTASSAHPWPGSSSLETRNKRNK